MTDSAFLAETDWEARIAAWRQELEAALERDGDDLVEIPQIADPETSEGRAAVIKGWQETADRAVEKKSLRAALRIAEYGVNGAERYLHAPGLSSLTREAILSLYLTAGVAANNQRLFEIADGFFRKGVRLSEQFLFGNSLGSLGYERTIQLLFNAGNNSQNWGRNQDAEKYQQIGIRFVPEILSSARCTSCARQFAIFLFDGAVKTQIQLQRLESAEALFEEGCRYGAQFLQAGEASIEFRSCLFRLFATYCFFSADKGELYPALSLFHEGFFHALSVISNGSKFRDTEGDLLKLLASHRLATARNGAFDFSLELATTRADWWNRIKSNPDSFRLQLNWSMGRIHRHFGDDNSWPFFLRSLLLDWHAPNRPHGNFGGALDGEGRELTPVQTAVAALEGLVLWEHAQRNRGIRTRFERLSRLREAVADAHGQWQERNARERPRLVSQRRRLQKLRRVVRRHRPLGAFLPGLDRRLARNRQRLERPRAQQLWRAYEDLRTSLGGWVLEGLTETLGLWAGLTEEADLLLAAAARTAGAGQDGSPALLHAWLTGEPPWRDSEGCDALLAPLAEVWPEDGEVPIDHWLEHLGLDTADLSVAQELRYGPAPALGQAFAAWAKEDDPEPFVRLLEAAWARACREGEQIERVANALAEGEGIDAVYPPPTGTATHPLPTSPEATPSEALLDALLTWQGLGRGLRDESSLLLGALFAVSLRQEPDTKAGALVRRWQEAPPWHDDADPGLAELQRAWFARDGEDRKGRLELPLLGSERREPPPPIRRWLQALALEAELVLDVPLANGPVPALERAFAAASRGERAPLIALLESAWQQAQRKGKALVRLQVGVAEGWINGALRDMLAAVDWREDRLTLEQKDALFSADSSERKQRTALAAVLRGQAREALRPNVSRHLMQRARQPSFLAALGARLCGRAREHLEAQITATLAADAQLSRRVPLYRLERAAARLYATAVHLHPGQSGDAALTERLHQWARAALQEASTRGDLEGIWSALETGRIALSGLALRPPDTAWTQETADLLRQALSFAVEGDPDNPDWRRGWPPLTAWIQQSEQLRPAGITVTACQARLRPGEALVQPFFLPDTGALQALWLTAEDELQRQAFPSACDEAHWQGTVLGPWSQWLAGVTREEAVRAWRKPGAPAQAVPAPPHAEDWEAILTGAPVRSFAETLADWARAAGIERLIVLLPAPLGQLPWESLPDSPLPAGMLVRAVALAHWRRNAPGETEPTRWTFYDAEGLHFAGLEAHCVDRAPRSNRTHTSADVLAGLRAHTTTHLILHGRYQRFAPLRSGLQVRRGQFLPLWLPSAVGVGARLVVLSACESNLSGQATRNLLGPVGIGPACVAAGAQAVLGTLWPCHDLATVVFIDHLTRVAAEQSWHAQPLAVQVGEAAQRLRRMSGEEVRARIERLAEGAGEDFACYDKAPWQAFYRSAQPFAHPEYRAPFVLLGEFSEEENTSDSSSPRSGKIHRMETTGERREGRVHWRYITKFPSCAPECVLVRQFAVRGRFFLCAPVHICALHFTIKT